MIPSLVGMTVARAIPDATLAGLAFGKYALHGGVVRHAIGTPAAGQIVAHLLPAIGGAGSLLTGAGIVTGIASVVGGIGALVGAGFSIANFVQSKKILKAVQQTMQVAELNLAVSQAGFAALDRRLLALETTLRTVEKTVRSIQHLLESTQRAELCAALEHLEKLPTIGDERVRIELLTHSATVLGKLRHLYRDQLQGLTTIPAALATEEYFLIAALAQARCYAELREPAMARAILSDAVREWRIWARTFARVVLLGDQPYRFLYADFAPSAPLPLISAWLDFAYDKQEGLLWIETLRLKQGPWFYHRSLNTELREAGRAESLPARDTRLAFECERVIPTLNKLVARDGVLASYEAQYALMEQHRLTPGELEASLLALTPSADDEDEAMLVLLVDETAG